MTQENIELLATDISARVKYGVQVMLIENEETMKRYKLYLKPYPLKPMTVLAFINYDLFGSKYKLNLGGDIVRIEDCKPFLRPMSSMTEEELEELLDEEDIDFDGKGELVRKAMMAYSEGNKLESNSLFSMQYAKAIDWLNAHHFDFRNLIEKGLALEAPSDMYK